MKKIEFTHDFYKEVYKKIMDKQSCYDAGDGFDFYPTIYVDFKGVRYQIDIEVTYASEFRDESFDHAFGTWVDEYAGYYFADGLDGIGNVDVWDDEDGEGRFIISTYGQKGYYEDRERWFNATYWEVSINP